MKSRLPQNWREPIHQHTHVASYWCSTESITYCELFLTGINSGNKTVIPHYYRTESRNNWPLWIHCTLCGNALHNMVYLKASYFGPPHNPVSDSVEYGNSASKSWGVKSIQNILTDIFRRWLHQATIWLAGLHISCSIMYRWEKYFSVSFQMLGWQ